MLNKKVTALRLNELEDDFKFQLKRSNRCLDLCDTSGSERWLKEAKNTLKRMSDHLKVS